MQKPSISKVRQMVARSNEIQPATLVCRWTQRPALITYPTGLVGYLGRIEVAAPGFRSRTMLVETDDQGTLIH